MSELTSGNNVEPTSGQKNEILTALHSFVDAQSKEVEVKKQELEVRSKEIDSNERIAMRSIDAQEKFHTDNRSQYNKHLIHKYVYVAVLVIIVAVFAVFLVKNDAKDLVVEVLKLLMAFGAGAFGGFQAGKNKKDSGEG